MFARGRVAPSQGALHVEYEPFVQSNLVDEGRSVQQAFGGGYDDSIVMRSDGGVDNGL